MPFFLAEPKLLCCCALFPCSYCVVAMRSGTDGSKRRELHELFKMPQIVISNPRSSKLCAACTVLDPTVSAVQQCSSRCGGKEPTRCEWTDTAFYAGLNVARAG